MADLLVKRFKCDGILHFADLLSDERVIRNNDRKSFDTDILANPDYVEDLNDQIKIDTSKIFSTRYELGKYIYTSLKRISLSGIEDDHGVWAWIACAFMDTICPPGTKCPGENARYIPSEVCNKYRLFYRHLIRGPYSVIKGVADGIIDKKFGKLLLRNPPYKPGAFYENCYSRQRIRRNKSTQKALVYIYSDSKGELKPGHDERVEPNDLTSLKGKGGVRRFNKIIIPRIQENFDIERLNMVDFIEAWGDEIKTSHFMEGNESDIK